MIATLDETQAHGTLLHAAVFYPRRLPRWEDLQIVRLAFFPPGADVMSVMPRLDGPQSANPFTVNLYSTPTEWGMA